MQSVGLGLSGLQSGFVLAAIILAVLFAERLGGTAELVKRVFQVALGVGLVLLTISATTAFVRPPRVPDELLEFGGSFESSGADGTFFEDSGTDGGFFGELSANNDEDEKARRLLRETAQNASEVRTIHIGVAVVFILTGLALTARMTVLPLATLLGGALLLLVGGVEGEQPSNFLDAFTTVFSAFLPPFETLDAGRTHDVVRFIVLLAGVVALTAFGYLRWERPVAAPPEPEGTPL